MVLELLNRAIQGECCISPTVNDIALILNGAIVFLKLDLIKEYHQLEQASASYLPNFSTHISLRWYKRLTSGMYSVIEIFQDTVKNISQYISSIVHYTDDMLVYGNFQLEHDVIHKVVFQCLVYNLTLNK